MAGRGVSKQREAGAEKSRSPRARGVPGKTRSSASLPMLRTSERSTLKRCEFLWDLTFNRNLKPLTDAPALRFGSLVHAALADWYIVGTKRGRHPAKAFKKHYDRDMRRNNELFGTRLEEEERWVNAEELGIAMLTNYVDEYGTDPDWEVLATEMPFKVLVHKPWTVDPNHPVEAQQQAEPWFWYTGILDGVWKQRRTRELWIPDHKTTAGIHRKLAYLQMDDQAGSYWTFGVEYLIAKGILKTDKQLHGMLYNFLRKAMPDERQSKLGPHGERIYLNLDGSPSKKQPPPYFLRQPIYRDAYDRQVARDRALTDYRRTELFRSGELEMSKSPGMFTCPMCPLSDACELHETGGDFEGFLKQTSQTWDPYAEHEVYDGR